jgi:hypothetical protein
MSDSVSVASSVSAMSEEIPVMKRHASPSTPSSKMDTLQAKMATLNVSGGPKPRSVGRTPPQKALIQPVAPYRDTKYGEFLVSNHFDLSLFYFTESGPQEIGQLKDGTWLKKVYSPGSGFKWVRVSKTSINEDSTKFVIGYPLRGQQAVKFIMNAASNDADPDTKYQIFMEFGEPGDSYCGICGADVDDSEMSVWSANGTLNEDIICMDCKPLWTFNPSECTYTRNA